MNDMKFQTTECPLCGNMLTVKSAYGVVVYSCPSEHYQVEREDKETIQHIYVFPYAIDNYASTNRSRIYRWKNERWSFVKDIPRFQLTETQQLFEIVKNVVVAHDAHQEM